jgi:hypothetical protein
MKQRPREKLQLPDPNIPEAHQIAMILQNDGFFHAVRLVFSNANVFCTTPDGCIVLHQYAIVNNGDPGL